MDKKFIIKAMTQCGLRVTTINEHWKDSGCITINANDGTNFLGQAIADDENTAVDQLCKFINFNKFYAYVFIDTDNDTTIRYNGVEYEESLTVVFFANVQAELDGAIVQMLDDVEVYDKLHQNRAEFMSNMIESLKTHIKEGKGYTNFGGNQYIEAAPLTSDLLYEDLMINVDHVKYEECEECMGMDDEHFVCFTCNGSGMVEKK